MDELTSSVFLPVFGREGRKEKASCLSAVLFSSFPSNSIVLLKSLPPVDVRFRGERERERKTGKDVKKRTKVGNEEENGKKWTSVSEPFLLTSLFFSFLPSLSSSSQ